jgi:hypothetical protein
MTFQRAVFVVAGLVAVLVAVFVAYTAKQAADYEPAQSAAAPEVRDAAPPRSRSVPPAIPPAPSIAPARNDTAAQTAHGEIHFERADARVDLDPRHGFGLWQPTDHRLRVVLTERPLTDAETAALARTLATGAPELADTHALLELTFQPTAQAFDRNDLESAALTLTSKSGAVAATADILGSIDWRGTLPAPGTSTSTATLVLSASVAKHAFGDWQQSWSFDVAIPVALAN